MSVGPPPPVDPWHRRVWGYYNQPYAGCGCLWTLLIIIIIWWILALWWEPAGFGYRWRWW